MSLLFVIMAVSNYFGAGKVYPVLISTSFIIYLLGEIVIFGLNYHLDRRKVDSVGDDKMPWMFKRQTD